MFASNPSAALKPKTRNAKTGFFCLRVSSAFALCLLSIFCAILGSSAQTGVIATPASNTWSIVPSPNRVSPIDQRIKPNVLSDIACTSSSDCWAVGNSSYQAIDNSTIDQSLIEHWDGDQWEIVTSPNISDSHTNDLNAVACSSTTDCWAVGTGGYRSLFEHWDGTSWSIVASNDPTVTAGVLTGVACNSSSDCWAVGYYWNAALSSNQSLIVYWDGISWSLATSPAVTNEINQLQSVTCTSSSNCWAVGSFRNGIIGTGQTLIEHWNGSAWAIVPSPNGSLLESNSLVAVSCNSSLECWTVGSFNNKGLKQTLVERWDGAAWVFSPSTNADVIHNNSLVDVTCESLTECWALGFNDSFHQIIDQWNGVVWQITDSANAGNYSVLSGATCVPNGDCWAVGYYIGGLATDGWEQTLIERYVHSTTGLTPTPTATPTPPPIPTIYQPPLKKLPHP